MNRQSNADLSLKQKPLKKFITVILKFIAVILGVVLLAVTILVFIFWYQERERDQLIVSYQVPPGFLEDIFARGRGPVSVILKPNETVICVIDGYGNAESLVFLNKKQKASLPKANLPSEDLAWYLLFFSNDSVSRIYLINSTRLGGNVNATGAGCVDREGQFAVLKTQDAYYGNQFVLNLISKGDR